MGLLMISHDIIKERLREIDENTKILARLKKMDKEKFVAAPDIFKLAERCLEINIQAILDIGHHIIAGGNMKRPRDNKDVIQVLAAEKIIPRGFAKKIVPMIGLRNILVHEYIKIDPEQIYRHLRDLGDFCVFQKHIIGFMEKAEI